MNVPQIPPLDPQQPISMRGVTKLFPGEKGVRGLTLDVPEGSIMGLVGPSGCGKTTTVRLLTGVYAADAGTMAVLGQSPAHFSTRTRARIGYMPQHYVLSPRMTVWETIGFVASLYGLPWILRHKQLREALRFVELENETGKSVGKLSGGMQRRLQLACTLVANPALIFADEPTGGVDPVLRVKFWDHFHALRDSGHTLLVTTQYVSEVAYCDRVAVMREGRLLTIDTPDGLRRAALGGEPFSVQVPPDRVREAMHQVDALPEVKEVRMSRSRPGVFYVTADDAAAAIPRVTKLLAEENQIAVENAEEYKPSFDDVFVQLMRRFDEEEDGRAAAAQAQAEAGHA